MNNMDNMHNMHNMVTIQPALNCGIHWYEIWRPIWITIVLDWLASHTCENAFMFPRDHEASLSIVRTEQYLFNLVAIFRIGVYMRV
jgi:hypothetical protein